MSKLKVNIKDKLNDFTQDSLFHFTFFCILIKSILFIGLIPVNTASHFDFLHAFYGVPPLLVYCSVIMLFLSFCFIFKNRARVWFLFFINLFITILLIGDLWYFRGFSSFLSLNLLKETSNLDNLSGSIFSMLHAVDFLFVIDIVFLLFIIIKNRKMYTKVRRNVFLFLFIFAVSSSYLGYAHYKIDVLNKGYENQMLFRVSWSPNQTVSNLTPLGYHIFDTYNFIKESKKYVLSSTEKNQIKSWISENKETIPDNNHKGIYKGKNLLVIQVESLENFVINQKVNGEEITPNINKLLKNSMYFDNFYEQVYNGTSSDADLMTNTSVFPTRSGSTFFRFPDNTYNSLPKILESYSYNTTAIHPDKGSYWNWMPALTSIGFNKCIDSSKLVDDENIGLGLSDASYLRQIEPIIAKQKQPFYTFFVTLTSHAPFDLPSKYRELNLPPTLNSSKLGGYFQSVHYTDKYLGKFLDTLDKDGILDNTVVVLYGDHCGIHKYYQDEVNKLKPSEDWWVDNHTKIPLIIYQKNSTSKTIHTIGGQIDTMPTICYLLGVDSDKYANTVIGRNLLNTNKDFAVLANRTYVGKETSEKEKDFEIKSIDISNSILQGNYFKEQK